LDNIGQLWNAMVTYEVLKIRWSNSHRPALALAAAEADRPQDFILDQAAHGLLGYVQDLRGFCDGVERL
jgi:hypothetical protein